jgi:RNA polymerase sigma-70 factor (ECF subfamily)
MVGTVHEAEDIVQETYLRASRSQGSFEGRSPIRTWLYSIATNQCLTVLGSRQLRTLPSGLFAPGQNPDVPMTPADGERLWLEQLPDFVVGPDGENDPADIIAARSSLRLAFVASLQHLAPRQRAVFILRVGLRYRAAEVAEMLDISVAAVKSALQRARARLNEVAPTTDELVEPDSPQARAILDRYMDAFERADIDAMNDLLRSDARLELVPSDVWFQGKATCVCHLRARAMTEPRALPIAADHRQRATCGRCLLPTVGRRRLQSVRALSADDCRRHDRCEHDLRRPVARDPVRVS